MASEIRVNKIENRSGLGTVTFADTGVYLAGIVTATTFSGSGASLTNIPAANVTGTLPAISGANLTNLPAANLSGALPAISAANLTNVPAANITGTLPAIDGSNLTGIGGTDFIHAEQISVSGVTTSQAFIPSQGQLSHRNILINGAMNIAQRDTSSTSVGYQTCDRWYLAFGGTDEAPTQAQADLSSSDTPYSSGFRKSYKITNGNQTSTDAADYLVFYTVIEAQDLAKCGWNYTSTSSYITLSFWAKSSVTKTFDVKLTTNDGTAQQFNHKFALSANTWKKVEIPIPGNSNITINNDNGKGVEIQWDMYSGTNYTSGSTVDQWVTYNGNTSAPDETADWWTTNDATFELTGVQLEVGQVATPFEHLSEGEDLRRCLRYYFKIGYGVQYCNVAIGIMAGNTQIRVNQRWPVPMRAAPTLTQSGLDVDSETASAPAITGFGNQYSDRFAGRIQMNCNTASFGQGQVAQVYTGNTTSYLAGEAEL